MRRPSSLVVAVLLVLLAAGCAEGESAVPATSAAPVAVAMSGPDREPFRVGAVLDRSGPDASLEGPVAAAVEAQVARLEASGGVLERPVELLLRDSAGDLGTAIEETAAVISAGADVVVLGCRADVAAAAAAVAEDLGVPAVAACVTDGSVGADIGPLTFGIGIPGAAQGEALARLAAGAGELVAVTVAEIDRPGSSATCDAFTRFHTELGGRVLAAVELAPGGLDADDVASVVRDTAPAVVVSCAGPDAARATLAAVRAAGWGGRVLATTEADGLALAGTEVGAGGAVAVLSAAPGRDRAGTAGAGTAAQRADLETRAGMPLGGTALAGAAAVELLASAATDAGSFDAEDLADALTSAEHRTVLGPLRLDADHHLEAPVPLHLLVVTADGTTTLDPP